MPAGGNVRDALQKKALLFLNAEPEFDFGPVPPISDPPRFHREEDPVTFEPDLEWEEPDTAEIEPVAVAHQPVQHEVDGVTESADWGWDDPEDFSAPV